MSIESLRQHIEDNDGYCTTCKAFTADGGIEPDAHQYECPVCEKKTLYGTEQAIVLGLLDGSEDDESDEDGRDDDEWLHEEHTGLPGDPSDYPKD